MTNETNFCENYENIDWLLDKTKINIESYEGVGEFYESLNIGKLIDEQVSGSVA